MHLFLPPIGFSGASAAAAVSDFENLGSLLDTGIANMRRSSKSGFLIPCDHR